MAISFNEIGQNLRAPIFAAEFDETGTGISPEPYRNLITGIGASNTGTLTRVFKGSQFSLFGDSPITEMLDIFFQINPLQEVYAFAFPEPSGGKAVHTITVTGTATASGTTQLYLNGRRVEFTISSGDDATDVATAIQTALDALPTIPVTVGRTSGVVTLTAKYNGAYGQLLDLRSTYSETDRSVAGITVAFANTTTGTGNVSYSTLVSGLDSKQYNVVVAMDSLKTTVDPIITELVTRYGALSEQEGILFLGADATLAALTTLGESFNSNIVTLIGSNNSPSPPYHWAAAYAAAAGVSLSNDPAQPLHTLRLRGVLPPLAATQFDYTERNGLLFSGVSTYRATDSNQVLIDSAITTYRETAGGVTSTAFLNLENVATLFFLRKDLNNYLRSKYSRAKVADDGTILPAGQTIVTPSVLKSEIISRAIFWSQDLGLIEDPDGFAESLVIERNTNNPDRFDIIISPDLINQFKIAATRIAFIR